VTEIRVEVPDALVASDLTWHVQERAEIFRGARHTVRFSVPPEDVDAALAAVRAWLVLRGLGSVVVELGEERLTLNGD